MRTIFQVKTKSFNRTRFLGIFRVHKITAFLETTEPHNIVRFKKFSWRFSDQQEQIYHCE